MKPILNASFELPSDGWVQLVPRGEFPVRFGGRRLIQVCDQVGADGMVAAFNRAACREDFAGVLVDYDHFSDDSDHSTEAAGWIVGIQNRADGVYAKIRWTDNGEAAVRGGRFRFLSPVFLPRHCDAIANSADRIRPMEVDRAALTNDPNMRTIRPISNRAGLDPETEPADPGEQTPGNTGREESEMDYKAQLLALLGLAPEATDEEITAAIEAKQTAAAEMEAETAKLENRAATAEHELAELRRADLEKQVDADLAANAGKIQNRDMWRERLLADREGTLKLLADIPEPAQKVFNRRDASHPERELGADRDAQAKDAAAAKIRNRAHELQATHPRASFSARYKMAEEELA